MKNIVWKAEKRYCYRKLVMFNGRSARRRAVESRKISLTSDFDEKIIGFIDSDKIYGYDKVVVNYNDGSVINIIGGDRDAVSELLSSINFFCGGDKSRICLHKDKLNSAYRIFDFVIDKK